MSEIENPSAFPFQVSNGPEMHEPSYGMTLRDWFAGQALVGYIASTEYGPMSAEEVAAHCFATAEAMLAARSRS